MWIISPRTPLSAASAPVRGRMSRTWRVRSAVQCGPVRWGGMHQRRRPRSASLLRPPQRLRTRRLRWSKARRGRRSLGSAPPARTCSSARQRGSLRVARRRCPCPKVPRCRSPTMAPPCLLPSPTATSLSLPLRESEKRAAWPTTLGREWAVSGPRIAVGLGREGPWERVARAVSGPWAGFVGRIEIEGSPRDRTRHASRLRPSGLVLHGPTSAARRREPRFGVHGPPRPFTARQ